MGKRKFLGMFGKASLGVVFVANTLKLNVLASESAPVICQCVKPSDDWTGYFVEKTTKKYELWKKELSVSGRAPVKSDVWVRVSGGGTQRVVTGAPSSFAAYGPFVDPDLASTVPPAPDPVSNCCYAAKQKKGRYVYGATDVSDEGVNGDTQEPATPVAPIEEIKDIANATYTDSNQKMTITSWKLKSFTKPAVYTRTCQPQTCNCGCRTS